MRSIIFALLAFVIVSTDSGLYPAQLLANASEARSPGPLLWAATRQGNSEAQARLLDYATGTDDTRARDYWLEQLVSVDDPEAAWLLYQQAGPEQSADSLMRLAARGNVPEAQLEFAMDTDAPQKREKWLMKAAEQGYQPAQAALADWYLLQQQPDAALPWLEKTAQDYPQSAFKLGRLLWSQHQREAARHWLQVAADSGHAQAQRFTRVMHHFQPQTIASVTAHSWTKASQCHQRIQMFATSLSSIERASHLYQDWQNEKRLDNVGICIAAPLWIEDEAFTCSANYKQQGRLGCDLRPLADAVEKREATHIIVVSDLGIANVNNGAMFLDISDSYSVMVHELAHFAGFVDEYPLSRSAARKHCKVTDAPNLVVDGKVTYRPVTTALRWQQTGRLTGISESKSCEAIGQKAYKPSRQITFLEHHDSGVIPPVYLRLWQQQLKNPQAQRPVYMNLFQAFHYAGNQQAAGKWLDKYNAFTQPAPTETAAPEQDIDDPAAGSVDVD